MAGSSSSLVLLFSAAVLLSCGAVYAEASDVLELNPSTFKSMLSSDDIYFVEFYAPWYIIIIRRSYA
jgi:hypothetical protein